MNIRPVEPADAQAIADLVNASYTGFDPEFRMVGRRHQTGDRIRSAIVDRGELGVVIEAEDGDGLRGVALWRPYGEPVKVSHLHLLFILPDQNRQGLGTQLIRSHWEQSIADWPELQLFTLNVLEGSFWALPFYAKHGYRIYQTGDERAVPGLGSYMSGPQPPGRSPLGPHHILHHLLAEQVPS